MVGDIADLDGWTREMARVLALGGHLVYSDFHPSWAQHGWSRTFRSRRRRRMHDVSFNPHTIDDHLAALEQAGLRVRTIREPRFSFARRPRASDQAVPPALGQPAGRRRLSRGEGTVIWANARLVRERARVAAGDRIADSIRFSSRVLSIGERAEARRHGRRSRRATSCCRASSTRTIISS